MDIPEIMYEPTPVELTEREQAEKLIELIETLRALQTVMQKGAAKIYGINSKTQGAWQEYNTIISNLVAKANAGELSEAELVQLQQFQKLTPPEFVQSINNIFANLDLLATGIYQLDAATNGKWIGVYRPPVVVLEPEEELPEGEEEVGGPSPVSPL